MTSLLRNATVSLKGGSFDDIMPGWASPPQGYLGRSSTGHTITAETPMAVSVAYRCIALVAGSLAKVPLKVIRRTTTGVREEANDQPAYKLLHDSVASNMTSYAWRRAAMLHLLTWGNSYSEKVLNGFGQLTELALMRPDRMERIAWENGARVYYYRNVDGTVVRMTQDRVFHVPGMGFDGLVGYAPLTLMRETLGSYFSARDFGQAVFTNGARPSVVIKHPKLMNTGAIERLTAQMDRLRGSKNAGKTVLLEEGATLDTIGFTPEDAQFLQTKQFELSDLATWYGVPPHMVGLVDRSTSWGSGIEEQTLGFLTFTMDDWFVNWEQEINLQLLAGTGTFAEFTREALLRMNALEQAQVLDIEARNGVVNPDEWRDLKNRPPLPDGEGETFVRPANMTVIGADGTTTRMDLTPINARGSASPSEAPA